MDELKFCSVCDHVETDLIFDKRSEKWYCGRHLGELLGKRETFAQEYSIYEVARKHSPGHWIPMAPDSNVRGIILAKVPPPPRKPKVKVSIQELALIFLLQPASVVEALFEDGELIHRRTYVLKALAEGTES